MVAGRPTVIGWAIPRAVLRMAALLIVLVAAAVLLARYLLPCDVVHVRCIQFVSAEDDYDYFEWVSADHGAKPHMLPWSCHLVRFRRVLGFIEWIGDGQSQFGRYDGPAPPVEDVIDWADYQAGS